MNSMLIALLALVLAAVSIRDWFVDRRSADATTQKVITRVLLVVIVAYFAVSYGTSWYSSGGHQFGNAGAAQLIVVVCCSVAAIALAVTSVRRIRWWIDIRRHGA